MPRGYKEPFKAGLNTYAIRARLSTGTILTFYESSTSLKRAEANFRLSRPRAEILAIELAEEAYYLTERESI